MNSIIKKELNIPVVKEVDVLVAGGGYAGFGAALAAARAGAKTIIIEQLSCLGGLVTLGYVALTFSYIEGYGIELFQKLKDADAVKGRFIDVEKTKRIMEQMLIDSGVTILYCTTIIDAIVEEQAIKGVIIHSKSGFQAIKAKRIVDATGDGDVAALAGVPFEVGDPEHNDYNQSASLVCRIGNVDLDKYAEFGKAHNKDVIDTIQDFIEEAVANGDFPYMIDKRFNWLVYVPGRDRKHAEVLLCYAHSRNCRCLDVEDLTRMYIEQRQQTEYIEKFLLKYIGGFENCWLIDTAPLMGVRDSRRIMGEYKIKADDLVACRSFEDAIARDHHAFDAHHPTEPGHIKHILRKTEDGSVEKQYVRPGSFREISYRAIVPLKIENLLIAGRCISADFMAQSGTRLVLLCLNLGQAAGLASAISLNDNVTPRKIDVQKLRKQLINIGFALNQKPYYGESRVATDAKIGKDDFILPGSDKYSQGVARVIVANPNLMVENDIDTEIRHREKSDAGYTSTGGDVGTNRE
ncbi:MAG: FAD-dependent oxidoreductase [Bacillota bacterium]|nr:FAD-dependent oxidoreductase [Bacillota bacterium]